MPRHLLFNFLLLLCCSQAAIAQFGFSHELGVIVGPVAFQSDYGERHDFSTNAGNTGFGIGLIHYLNFSYKADCNCYTPETFFNDHFKLRSEISYSKTKLENFGESAEKPNSAFGRLLRGMHGETAVTDIGMQLEYFPLSIRDFTATIGALAPFVSLGAHFSYYNPDSYSSLGDGVLGQDPTITPVKFFDAFDTQGGTTWSIVSSIGTRYKLTELSDLMIDLRGQYYFSNWVDGLSPNPKKYPENKANDWLIWLNVGYIYYLQ